MQMGFVAVHMIANDEFEAVWQWGNNQKITWENFILKIHISWNFLMKTVAKLMKI